MIADAMAIASRAANRRGLHLPQRARELGDLSPTSAMLQTWVNSTVDDLRLIAEGMAGTVEALSPLEISAIVEVYRSAGITEEEASAALVNLIPAVREVRELRGEAREALRAKLEASVRNSLEAAGMPIWAAGVEYEPGG